MRDTDARGWTAFQWHCTNCGNIVTGYRNDRGLVKVDCRVCGVRMVRSRRNAGHDTIEVYAPETAGIRRN